ncbi:MULTISPECIES: hypothetical protein [Derxia]|uniref:Uncharacterized protein n=1 Tax=Derxia gummosa DSM 723 TaxID=1121388 RepID=A0A8B6X3A1_9BURK|nr:MULTISPECIES: hypothetical protein [Derxia]
MPRNNIAFIERAKVPALTALNAAIAGLKFKLVVEHDYKPFEIAGYLPCTLDGEDAGFDMRFASAAEHAGKSEALGPVLGARDVAIAIKWGGDPREVAAAYIVIAALAKDFDALVIDADKGTLFEAAKLVTRARNSLDEL